MPLQKIVRGTAVTFAEMITDANGNVVVPASVTLTIAYLVNGAAMMDTYLMAVQADNSWAYSWDSTPADASLVQWCITAVGQSKVVAEGCFQLVANAANLQE